MRRLRLCLAVLIGIVAGTIALVSHAGSDPATQISELKNPKLSNDDKTKVGLLIQSEGTTAIPALIACLKDPAPVGTVPLEGGECINRPANQPVPPQCVNPVRTVTLGERCEQMLYSILTPAYTSPYMTMLNTKQAPPPPFVISDWKAWWAAHQSQSLDQIHAEARQKIDAFWKNNHQKSIDWN